MCDLGFVYISIEDTATYLDKQIGEVRHTRDEALAQLPGLKHAGPTAPEPRDCGKRSSRTAVRRPSLGVISTASLIEWAQGTLCEAKIAVRNTASALLAHVCSTIAEHGVFRGYDFKKPYPFDCGSHAVKIPGSGLVDFKVHVASCQDTQSASISNVELEFGAPLATLKEHRLAKTNAASFMAGIRGLTNLALGPEGEDAGYPECIICIKGVASMVT